MQTAEALKIFGGHVLCVLDAPAAIAVAVCFFDVLKNIEHGRNRLIADRVNTKLQPGFVCPSKTIAHTADGLHLVGE